LDPIEPRPRSVPWGVNNWQPLAISKRDLPAPTTEPRIPFLQVLEQRRSNAVSRELPFEALAELLWHGARARETGRGRLGLPWEHRSAPSAGGIHPIELFVRVPGPDGLNLYDPLAHALASVEVVNNDELFSLDRQVAAAAPTARGTIVILVANTNRAEAAYEGSESLVWRDAGCLMMTLHLVAEYLGLAFCPIGVLGTALVRALGEPTGWVAAGTCVVGTRTHDLSPRGDPSGGDATL
jgi:SagB-type dehydrogenase family enzyme